MEYTEEEIKLIESKYYTFCSMFYENEQFLDVVRQVEDDLFILFRDSPKEKADEAYYEIQGLKRFLNKLNTVKNDYNMVLAYKEMLKSEQ